MSIRSKMVGVLGGKYQGNSELLREYQNKATKRWFATNPRRGSVLFEKGVPKFLTPKEKREYKRAKNEISKEWRNDLASGKYRKMICTQTEPVPVKKLGKVV